MEKINSVIEKLSKDRNIFHSEADFQHALAWKLHQENRQAKIFLEYPQEIKDKRIYIDIFIIESGNKYAIELKYKTKYLVYKDKDENDDYKLLNQSANDISRYDFLKDIQRLELLKKKHQIFKGYAVFLTNDHLYWEKSKYYNDTIDSEFHIHKGRELNNRMNWRSGASDGTKKGRETPIELKGEYQIKWNKYSVIEKSNKNNIFKYTLIEVL